MDDATDELLTRFRAGDRAAYDELVERYRQPLLRYIRSHSDLALRRQTPAEDLLQETHIEALKGLDSFTYRRELSFFFWLCRIAQRRVVHHHRKLKREPVVEPALPVGRTSAASSHDILAAVQARTPGPEQRVLLRENLDLVATALESLPDKYREAVLLVKAEGHDVRDVAARLGISTNAVYIRVSRGLDRLATALGELVDDRRPRAAGPGR